MFFFLKSLKVIYKRKIQQTKQENIVLKKTVK